MTSLIQRNKYMHDGSSSYLSLGARDDMQRIGNGAT